MSDAVSADQAWKKQLNRIISEGEIVSPGIWNNEQEMVMACKTLEVAGSSIEVLMNQPVITNYKRRLSYKFMTAEAVWILSGSNSAKRIGQYNKKMLSYSDDGETLFGAYGPRFVSQVNYVANTLNSDPSSRRAVLSIWRENPPQTRDTPCTLTMQFLLRTRRDQLFLDCITNMRSSDVWLGIPYDIFNFTMMALNVASLLDEGKYDKVKLGVLQIHMGSSHMYIGTEPGQQNNLQGAVECLREPIFSSPVISGKYEDFQFTVTHLIDLRNRSMNEDISHLDFFV